MTHRNARLTPVTRAELVEQVMDGWPQAEVYRVSLFRINVRLGGQHKCHSVRLRWYQVMASRAPRGIAASEDSPCPCIS